MENSTIEQTPAEKLPDPAPRFEGKAFVLGGRTYIVPPLSLRRVMEIASKIETLTSSATGVLDPAYLGSVLDVVAPAVQRNYPEITVDELADLIDLKNAFQLVSAALGRPVAVPSAE